MSRTSRGSKEPSPGYFSPRPDIWARLASRFDALLSLPHKTSLHVRRGDYLGHNGFFTILPVAYYVEAMAMTHGPYIVFSDDIDVVPHAPARRLHLHGAQPELRGPVPDGRVRRAHRRELELLMVGCMARRRSCHPPSEWGPAFGPAEPKFLMADCVVLDNSTMEEDAAS